MLLFLRTGKSIIVLQYSYSCIILEEEKFTLHTAIGTTLAPPLPPHRHLEQHYGPVPSPPPDRKAYRLHLGPEGREGGHGGPAHADDEIQRRPQNLITKKITNGDTIATMEETLICHF